MSSKTGGKNRFLALFDDWFIPMAFGVLTVLLCVQAISLVPQVRAAMDHVEGRFVAQPATAVPTAVKKDTAVVILTASSTQNATGVEVFLDNQSLGDFTTNQMRITVHDGQKIHFVDHSGKSIYISVDTDNANLLLPAPGQTVELSSATPTAALSSAEFI